MSIQIRRATIEDAAAIADFNIQMAMETEGKQLDAETILQGARTMISNANLGFYLVAEDEGRLVGSLMVTTEWSDWRNGLFWWVQSVYIIPDYRRRGIYSDLYAMVKHWPHRKIMSVVIACMSKKITVPPSSPMKNWAWKQRTICYTKRDTNRRTPPALQNHCLNNCGASALFASQPPRPGLVAANTLRMRPSSS